MAEVVMKKIEPDTQSLEGVGIEYLILSLQCGAFCGREPKTPKPLTKLSRLELLALSIPVALGLRSPALYFLRAGIYNASGYPNLASEECLAVLQHDPENTDALFGLALMFQRQHLFEDSYSYLVEFTRKDPDSLVAMAMVGNVYLSRGNVQTALQMYSGVLGEVSKKSVEKRTWSDYYAATISEFGIRALGDRVDFKYTAEALRRRILPWEKAERVGFVLALLSRRR